MWCRRRRILGAARRLRLSHDGGKTWAFVTGPDGKPLAFAGSDVSLSDPADANILFASNLRSATRAKHGRAMAGCDGVFTSAPSRRRCTARRATPSSAPPTTASPGRKSPMSKAGFGDLAVDE